MVQTVTGAIKPEELGKTFAHEHIVFGYVGWEGDRTICGEFDPATAMEKALSVLCPQKEQFGLGTIVDATPNDCGRDPLFLKEFSEKSGINVICSTGYYNEHAGGASYFRTRASWYDGVSELYELMTTEIKKGIWDTDIKAGVIKVGTGANVITDYEKMVFTAAAKASVDTNTAIITHTENGTCGYEQARLLISEGVKPEKIQIGHVGTTMDINHYKKMLDQGVFIAFDRIGITVIMGTLTDEQRAQTIAELFKCGYGDQILISHDVIGCRKGRPLLHSGPAAQYVSNYNWNNIFHLFIPRLYEAGLTERDVDKLLIDNPMRLYGGS